MVPATKDPLEKVNRGIFAFNHQFYRFIAKPIAKVTTTLIPDPVLNAVGNVFENLKSPVRISASLLQGKVGRAGKETAKLLVNSTVGLGGVWKASDKVVSLRDVPEEDFGQTFGTWGIPAGPYLVVPILGPRSLRDVAGEAVDTCATPQTWLHARDVRMWAEVADNIQLNPERMHIYDSSTKDALDPYIAVREAYTNYRTHAVSK